MQGAKRHLPQARMHHACGMCAKLRTLHVDSVMLHRYSAGPFVFPAVPLPDLTISEAEAGRWCGGDAVTASRQATRLLQCRWCSVMRRRRFNVGLLVLLRSGVSTCGLCNQVLLYFVHETRCSLCRALCNSATRWCPNPVTLTTLPGGLVWCSSAVLRIRPRLHLQTFA